jgi:hypothetical protein
VKKLGIALAALIAGVGLYQLGKHLKAYFG